MFDPDDLDALALRYRRLCVRAPRERPTCPTVRRRARRRQDDAGRVVVRVARELPWSFVPPSGLLALALESSGWAAPMDDDGDLSCRPSQHPHRRRMHHTAIVAGDGIEIGVLRVADDEPQIMRVRSVSCRICCWRVGTGGPTPPEREWARIGGAAHAADLRGHRAHTVELRDELVTRR